MSNLVLSRKAGESVKIGDTGLFQVLEVHPAKVYVALNNARVMLRLGNAVVGDNIKITCSVIGKGQAKFMFEADRSVSIVRSELLR